MSRRTQSSSLTNSILGGTGKPGRRHGCAHGYGCGLQRPSHQVSRPERTWATTSRGHCNNELERFVRCGVLRSRAGPKTIPQRGSSGPGALGTSAINSTGQFPALVERMNLAAALLGVHPAPGRIGGSSGASRPANGSRQAEIYISRACQGSTRGKSASGRPARSANGRTQATRKSA